MNATSFEHKEVWYLSSAEPDANSALRIIRIGSTTAIPGYARGPRIQSEYSLHFILQGALRFDYAETSVELQAGDLFLLTKERRCAYAMIPDGPPLQKVWMAFQGSQIGWLLERLDLTEEKPYLRQVVQSQAKALLQAILGTMKERQDREPLLLIGLFYQLLAACKAEKDRHCAVYSSANWVGLAKNYIDIHYIEPITLDDVCKHVSVSRGHFSEVFLQKFGVSPSRYLMRLRMERARHLVVQTDYSITEIAFSVGYESLFSFSRAFRNHYGRSPNTIRAKQTE